MVVRDEVGPDHNDGAVGERIEIRSIRIKGRVALITRRITKTDRRFIVVIGTSKRCVAGRVVIVECRPGYPGGARSMVGMPTRVEWSEEERWMLCKGGTNETYN